MHMIHTCRSVGASSDSYKKIADKNPNRSSIFIQRLTDSPQVLSLSMDGDMAFTWMRGQDDTWTFDESLPWDGEIYAKNSEVALMTLLVMEISKVG